MNKRNFVELGSYIRSLADEMGLKDWTIELINQEPDNANEYNGTGNSTIASCTPSPHQKNAWLRFRSDFDDTDVFPLREVRHVVCHELMHCHGAAMFEVCRNSMLDQLSQSTYNMFMFSIRSTWEEWIDGAARAWAEKFPLIHWPHPEK